MLLSLSETQSITPSDGRSPQRTCSAIWEPCQKECPSTGVTVCEWLCLRPRCLLRQSNPQWQQVGKTKSLSSLTIQLLSGCQRVKRQGLQTKKTPWDMGDGEKISSGKADLVCHTNLLHTWARKLKVFQPHMVVLDICTNYFGSQVRNICPSWCQLLFKTRKKSGRGGMWNASNALTICRVVLETAAAVAPSTMCKVKLSVWRLVKMSGPTGQHRAQSQSLTNLHSSFYRAGVEPEIHATYPNTTTHLHTHKH